MIKVTTKTKWDGDIVKIRGKKVISNSTYKIGLVVEGQAKELAARNFGYLAASINTQSITQGDELKSPGKYARNKPSIGHNVGTFRKIQKPNNELDTLVGTAVDYAPYQEFGTMKMSAQPFLRPALDLAQGKELTIVRLNAKTYFGDYLNARDIFLEMNK